MTRYQARLIPLGWTLLGVALTLTALRVIPSVQAQRSRPASAASRVAGDSGNTV